MFLNRRVFWKSFLKFQWLICSFGCAGADGHLPKMRSGMTKAVAGLSAVQHVCTIIVWQLKFIEGLLCAWQMRAPKDPHCTFASPGTGRELQCFQFPHDCTCQHIGRHVGLWVGNWGNFPGNSQKNPSLKGVSELLFAAFAQFKTLLLFIQHFSKCVGTSFSFLFPEQDFCLEVGLVCADRSPPKHSFCAFSPISTCKITTWVCFIFTNLFILSDSNLENFAVGLG